jgi:hypothetical protein|tara:strand:- start:321 stop:608 length:288 start_codon:yes stop_codon:yes gene_type:complete
LLNYSSGGLNQSNLNESLTHKEQINGLNLKKTGSMVGNDMSATDLEYLKFLQDNRGEQDVTNGSFFRSMVNVEVGGIQHNENKEEIHALKDINEQ